MAMKVSLSTLARWWPEVQRVLDRQQTVSILYRGKQVGILCPLNYRKAKPRPIQEHPAFGMWKDRKDMKDVEQFVRKLRKGRFTRNFGKNIKLL
jgi:hypothetical protein